MTLENARKLYEWFLESGQKEKAEEILKGRPEILDKKEEKKK